MGRRKGSTAWNAGHGTGVDAPRGYVRHRVKPGQWKEEHLLIAERILGRPLGKNQVHHWGTQDDNTRLVLCEDAAYHKLLHVRQAAYRAIGNADARKCHYCKRWGVPNDGDMAVHFRSARARGAGRSRHKSCHAKAMRGG